MPEKIVPQFERTRDFNSVYSNNVQFEMSSFDLRILFGQNFTFSGRPLVEQHTSVTLTWPQAKLLHYYLQVNLEIFESQHGKIVVPSDVLPPEPPPLPEEMTKNPIVVAVHERVKKMRADFISSSAK